MSDTPSLDALRHAAAAAQEALNTAENTVYEARQKDYVGRCHRYRNSSGSGTDWWLYRRVTHADGRWLYGMEFEIRPSGDIRVSFDTHFGMIDGAGTRGWDEIPECVFEAEWQRFNEFLLRNFEHGMKKAK